MKRNCLLMIVPLAVAAVVSNAPAAAADRPDVLIADFEGEDYGQWEAMGQAFGSGPARGTLPGQMPVSGFMGKGLVNSFYQGDRTTGTLTSPPLTIQRRYINFLVGGGKHAGKTCINLLVDGKVVHTATGPNDRPGGSEHLDWHSWDVDDLAGKTAVLQIVDRHTGGWGHINVDHIVQSDRRLAPDPAQLRRQLVIAERYLHLPVRNGAAKRRMRFLVNDQVVREFEIELADDQADFWVFGDVSRFQGKPLVVEVDSLAPRSKGLRSITQSDRIPGQETLYREKYRPQFHFTSRRGWNNDPNGLVFYQGEYHLFYQHNPYGWRWGNMHWGHAVSEDLLQWKELPIAIYPHRFGDWAFSGGAMVDWHNTAGWKTGDEHVIVASYTSTGRGECLAYSNDRGRTFVEYEGNPVVKHRGRDPKIIWYAPGKHWVMAVYDEFDKQRCIAFYTSANLKEWQFQSRVEGYYECPELFELPVDGDEDRRKWVIYAADGNYSIGSFDGKRFTSESGKHRGNYGNCFYASQTFSDIPQEDGRRIQIGWGRVEMPGMPFNQMMLFPCALTLKTTDEGIRMFANPVREINRIHDKKHVWQSRSLQEGENLLSGIQGELFDIRVEFEPQQVRQFGLNIRGVPLVYDVAKRSLTCQGNSAPLATDNGKIRLQILVDRTSIEIFGNEGRIYMPMGVILPDDNRSLEIFAKGGAARVNTLEVYQLRSIWH